MYYSDRALPCLNILHLSCLDSRHRSCLSSTHLSCLNNRHLFCLNRRHLFCLNNRLSLRQKYAEAPTHHNGRISTFFEVFWNPVLGRLWGHTSMIWLSFKIQIRAQRGCTFLGELHICEQKNLWQVFGTETLRKITSARRPASRQALCYIWLTLSSGIVWCMSVITSHLR